MAEILDMQEDEQKNMQQITGFRFYPTEEELVSFYLHNKLENNRQELNRVIPVINIYEFEPYQLPNFAGELCNGDTEQWFFFVPRQEREARGGRPNRTTASGYWKATGSPSYVYSSGNRVIGVKKSMVFYKGKAPTGKKTKWKMNEYRAIVEEVMASSSTPAIPKLRHEVSLCRVYAISGAFQAFDRRPLGTVTSNEENTRHTVRNCSLLNTYPSGSTMDRRSSPGTSSKREDTFHHMDNEGCSSNWEMDTGLMDLLDLEKLNQIK